MNIYDEVVKIAKEEVPDGKILFYNESPWWVKVFANVVRIVYKGFLNETAITWGSLTILPPYNVCAQDWIGTSEIVWHEHQHAVDAKKVGTILFLLTWLLPWGRLLLEGKAYARSIQFREVFGLETREAQSEYASWLCSWKYLWATFSYGKALGEIEYWKNTLPVNPKLQELVHEEYDE